MEGVVHEVEGLNTSRHAAVGPAPAPAFREEPQVLVQANENPAPGPTRQGRGGERVATSAPTEGGVVEERGAEPGPTTERGDDVVRENGKMVSRITQTPRAMSRAGNDTPAPQKVAAEVISRLSYQQAANNAARGSYAAVAATAAPPKPNTGTGCGGPSATHSPPCSPPRLEIPSAFGCSGCSPAWTELKANKITGDLVPHASQFQFTNSCPSSTLAGGTFLLGCPRGEARRISAPGRRSTESARRNLRSSGSWSNQSGREGRHRLPFARFAADTATLLGSASTVMV
jgi:hypothetical protein